MLLGFAVLLLLLVTVGLPYILARLVTSAGTRPQDLALISSPSDYDIDFENVRFDAADGVALSGWYLGGGDANLSVACGHGLFRSRREVWIARRSFEHRVSTRSFSIFVAMERAVESA